MAKARAHPGQLGFDFEAPAPASGVAALAGLERRISQTVGTILASDPRSRKVIAAEMSEILDEDVSWQMLDAYASPARSDHKVPMSRFWALLLVTSRQDLLDPLTRELGAGVLIGREVQTARLGQIDAMMEELKKERRRIKGDGAPVIRGNK
ncbi:hypothetical protein D2V17_14345 [Aurantiacibacter xanthus]|uniref:Uncharacterized protein n=1 Tax=Aurantiacibacter xanthus TaxID=1784712 RepID=A0A3A1P395_9SPHN|nr:hypothetical protein [Aurantiacibacter xanthus]RIV82978.1 hypothetical protein D2V17_14345 [Aurantiacibacter xanthus]